MSFHVPEKYRLVGGPYGSRKKDGNNGAFLIPAPDGLVVLRYNDGTVPLALTVIASDGEGWEHVSVSTPQRCPTWREMDRVKRLFWDDEDTVMQFHAPRSMWVSTHPYTLHLWRPTNTEISLPPPILVGIPKVSVPGRR